jgi:hypothetical protein
VPAVVADMTKMLTQPSAIPLVLVLFGPTIRAKSPIARSKR